jgi:glycosyltransferase involved in cell wall biosynthesis
VVYGKHVPNIAKTYKLRKIINMLITSILLHQLKPDILHETYFDNYQLAAPQTKVVLTVYDMIHEKFREDFTAKEIKIADRKLKAVNRADHVICISENTRKDLIEIANIAASKTSVIHLGFGLTEENSPLTDKIINRPYLLFVGHRGLGYKNFGRLLHAYAASPRLRQDFDLVCFGGAAMSAAEQALVTELGGRPEKVRRIGGDDGILASLYAHAAALIYPSLYEGFGIPVLEAMSLKCPVVCSNSSSMPEVAGDAAEFFDPFKIDSIAAAIEKVVYSVEKRNELISRGLDRIKQFSWAKCARQTYAVYESLL